MHVMIQQLDPQGGYGPLAGTKPQDDELEDIFDLDDPTEKSEYLLAVEMLSTGNMWVFETKDGSLWRLDLAEPVRCTWPREAPEALTGEGLFA